MKRFLFILLTLVCLLTLFSCGECEHEWQEATCTTPKTCKLCGETQGEVAAHTYGEWTETKASNCTEKGSESRSCVCGDTQSRELPLGDHTYTDACDPSCNIQGCTNTREVPHVFDHGCDDTCNTVGCGYTRQTSHAYDHACDPTCNKPGCGFTRVTEHRYSHACDNICNVNECHYKREIQHVYDNDCDTTCNTVGCGARREAKHLYDNACDSTCNVAGCGFSRTAPHNYNVETTLPTCEAGGYTTYTCKDCPYSYVGNEVGAHGHAYEGWDVYSPITSSSNGGIKRSNCLNCMKPKDEPIAVIASGYLGSPTPEDVSWILYEDGTLKIQGTGITFDCGWQGEMQPYSAHRAKVKRAVVGVGITELRGGVFAFMPNIEEYELPGTVTLLANNTFMDSFKSTITSLTIPASVTKIGHCVFGTFREKHARFTEIFIENPNTLLVYTDTDYMPFNSKLTNCSDLTIYSYGTGTPTVIKEKSNTFYDVKTFCDTYGIRFVDLETIVFGEVGNLKYNVLEGVMSLSAKDASKPVTLPSTQPWLDKLERSEIKTLNITAHITDIPASYFKDYTALTSVTLPSTVETIGAEAFATSSANSTALTFKSSDALTSVASDFLKNRTNVTVTGIAGTALDNFSQNGVTLNLKKSIKILLIGNSLSQDAADYTSNNQPSQLYNIIKAMAGEDCYVKIGALCNGAKSAGWHATMAETNAAQYQFNIISDDTNGLWTQFSNEMITSVQGLTSDKWDYITIQPYATETKTGVGSSTGDTDAKTDPKKDPKFYALKDSLPYLLDHFDTYCPDAKVYYYLTWSNYYSASWDSADDLVLNAEEEAYANMLNIAKTALTYKGTKSGKGFEGMIAGGTAIQNARSTYLGTQFYTTYNKPPAANKPDTTSWLGLQRDDVHLSFSTGRYIVGLSFAEILVPESFRLPTYTLPDIKPTVKGELPKAHTTIAQLCVQEMLRTSKLEGADKYTSVRIPGYTVDPNA